MTRERLSTDVGSATVLVLMDSDGGVFAHDVTIWDRWSTHLHADRLDRALAGGAAPESSVPLALRARELTSPQMRQRLAAALSRILDDAQDRTPAWNALGPTAHLKHVLVAIVELKQLIERLRAPSPVGAQGVALVHLLVTDGSTSPLLRRTSTVSLADEVVRATRALDPIPTWTP